MVTGAYYLVKMDVSPAEQNYITCCIGLVFGDTIAPDPPFADNLSNVELVIDVDSISTDQWYHMEELYLAQGGENFMSVGNFRPDADSQPTYIGENNINSDYAYFYIDNISITLDTLISSVAELSTSILKLYPNPNTGIFTLDFSLLQQDATLRIRNTLSQILFERKVDKGSTTITQDIKFNRGIYLLELDDGTDCQHQTMVVTE